MSFFFEIRRSLNYTPKQMADYARLERERWGRLIAANNIRLD